MKSWRRREEQEGEEVSPLGTSIFCRVLAEGTDGGPRNPRISPSQARGPITSVGRAEVQRSWAVFARVSATTHADTTGFRHTARLWSVSTACGGTPGPLVSEPENGVSLKLVYCLFLLTWLYEKSNLLSNLKRTTSLPLCDAC